MKANDYRFRAWDPESGWYYSTDLGHEAFWQYVTDDDHDVYQSSPFKDKNGKYIYEGHIIAAIDGECNARYEIKFSTQKGWTAYDPARKRTRILAKLSHRKIIGDIMNSPELLKGFST